MSKIKGELAAKCEMMLMGVAQKVDNQSDVNDIFKYLKSACDYADRYNDVNIPKIINKYTDEDSIPYTVEYITTYTIFDMPCIAFLLYNKGAGEDEVPYPFTEDYGSGCPSAFCYVFNLQDDTMSEFGDVFFTEKTKGMYTVATGKE